MAYRTNDRQSYATPPGLVIMSRIDVVDDVEVAFQYNVAGKIETFYKKFEGDTLDSDKPFLLEKWSQLSSSTQYDEPNGFRTGTQRLKSFLYDSVKSGVLEFSDDYFVPWHSLVSCTVTNRVVRNLTVRWYGRNKNDDQI